MDLLIVVTATTNRVANSATFLNLLIKKKSSYFFGI